MSHKHASSHHRHWLQAWLAGLGAVVAICFLAGITDSTHLPLLLGSFGSSAVLVFGFPESGFSKPARVVGAHVLCAAIGLISLHFCGPHWWAQALSVGLCVSVMLGLRLVHPPAGSNALLVFAMQPDWTFLLWPTLLGSLALVTLASIWQRLFPKPNHHA
jgi:CBS-domain-containing membrane protein